MIREDRELLAELARLNTDMASFAMRIMDGSAKASEQLAQRLLAAGERLQRRADGMSGEVIEGEVLSNNQLTLPPHNPHPTSHTLESRPE